MLVDERLHIINLSRDGTFQSSGEFSTRPEDIDDLFSRLAQDEVPQLTLYFHGGLVPEKNGLAAARALLPKYRGEGKNHPVFFVWESGWREIIEHNLGQIGRDTIFKRLLEIIRDSVHSKLEQPALEAQSVSLPEEEVPEVSPEEEDQLAERLSQDEQFQSAVSDLVASLQDEGMSSQPIGEAAGGEPVTMLSRSVVAEMLSEEEVPQARAESVPIASSVLIRAAIRILHRVVTRLRHRTGHGVYCTVSEEILRELYVDNVAGWLWLQMKEEIRQAFESNAGLSGNALRGGTYFLERLRDYLADPSHPPLKVSLVGHSAGSIYICRMVEAADKILPRDFQFNQIVFLAPGVDFELFKRTIVDHPNRFRSFRMFTMSDEFEVKDVMAPIVYPQSLLYFVSGLLEGDEEKPIVGLHRFYTPESPYDDDMVCTVRSFMLAEDQKRVVWSVMEQGEPGFVSGARAHGGFGNDPMTLESVLQLLAG